MQGRCKSVLKDEGYQSLYNQIEKNHLLVRVTELVDFNFVDTLTEPYYSLNTGRGSLPPQQYFKMMLVKHLYGIHSNRALVKEVRYNICYRWFCQFCPDDDIPHHASLSNIKKRFPASVYESFFLSVLEQCKEHGLVESGSIMTDSTLIHANASLDSMKPIEEDPNPTREVDKKKKKLSNATHRSTTDPDATLAMKKHKANTLKYKAHVSCDSDTRVITAIMITTGSTHDSQPYLEHIKYQQDRAKIVIQEVIADKAYGSGGILESLEQQGIKTYIPLFNSRSGSAESEAEAFLHYTSPEDYYICPNGAEFHPYPKKDQDRTLYRSKATDCKDCPLSNKCPVRIKGKGPARVIYRSDYHSLYEKVQRQMETEEFREAKYERLWKIEGVMNELKNHHDLNRASYRGIENMKVQSYMAAIALNIKRIVFVFIIKLPCVLIWKKYKQVLQQPVVF